MVEQGEALMRWVLAWLIINAILVLWRLWVTSPWTKAAAGGGILSIATSFPDRLPSLSGHPRAQTVAGGEPKSEQENCD